MSIGKLFENYLGLLWDSLQYDIDCYAQPWFWYLICIPAFFYTIFCILKWFILLMPLFMPFLILCKVVIILLRPETLYQQPCKCSENEEA